MSLPPHLGVPALPVLPTLALPRSWRNGGGRHVDRSACIEVRASEFWRRVAMCDVSDGGDVRQRGACADVVEAQGEVVVTEAMLWMLHGCRKPRRLLSDLRTAKSVAMRPTPDSPEGRWRARQLIRRRRASWRQTTTEPQTSSREVPEAAKLLDRVAGLPGNPNRGASCSKALGLGAGWSQTVAVERRRRHARLAHHVVICPRCGEGKRMLLMVLAWPEELRDAAAARPWLAAVAASHGNRPASALEVQVIERYGPLLSDGEHRRLWCGRCLGVRYGYARA